MSVRAHLVLALLLLAVCAGAAEGQRWKRPLSPIELWTSLQDVLALQPYQLGPVPELPALPLTLSAAQADAALAPWRAETARVAAMVVDLPRERPPLRRFRCASEAEHFVVRQVFGPETPTSAASVAGPTPDGLAVRLDGTAATLTVQGLPLPDSGFWRVAVRVSAVPRLPTAKGRYLPLMATLAVDGRILDRREVADHEVLWLEGQFHVAAAGATPVVAVANASGQPAEEPPALLVHELEIEGVLVAEEHLWPQLPHLRLVSNEPQPEFKAKKPKKGEKPVEPPPPLEEPTEAEALERFLTRTFRRPPTAAERSRYARLLSGAKPAAWLEVVRTALADPAFLYLEDHSTVTAGRPVALTAHERLARLTYALDGRPPRLEEMARSGLDPVDLVRGDNRAFPLRLATAWFELERLEDLGIDREAHPIWSPAYVSALRTEVGLLLRRCYTADRGNRHRERLADLLEPRVVFADDRLARVYDLLPSEQDVFRIYQLAPSHGRCGIVTTGALLALSAPDGDRTKRGPWIAQRLFGGLPAAEVAELSRLLAVYDPTGRWTRRPTVDQPLKDVAPLQELLEKHADTLQATAAAATAVALVGYPLPSGDRLVVEPDPGPEPKDRKKGPRQAGELRSIVRAVVRHQRLGDKW